MADCARREYMRDIDVRNALRQKVLAHHYRDSETLVVDELGLHHGSARIDMAVVNGRLHGFEIKSEADTLERLPAQMAVYRTVFDRVTMVCGSSHTAEVLALVPDHWGVKEASAGARGAVHFRDVRAPRDSAEVDAISLARLLWKDEAIAVLLRAGITRGIKSKNREALYKLIAKTISLADLKQEVRVSLRARECWRSGATHRPSGD